MTGDIVKRLREEASWQSTEADVLLAGKLIEAADEIERMRAENAKLLKGIELLSEAAKLLESEMKTLAATLGVTPSGADVPEMADIRRRATEHFGVPL